MEITLTLKFVAAAYTLVSEGKEMVSKPAAVTADEEFGEDIIMVLGLSSYA